MVPSTSDEKATNAAGLCDTLRAERHRGVRFESIEHCTQDPLERDLGVARREMGPSGGELLEEIAVA